MTLPMAVYAVKIILHVPASNTYFNAYFNLLDYLQSKNSQHCGSLSNLQCCLWIVAQARTLGLESGITLLNFGPVQQ
jgi:hypothetical protein